MHLEYDPLKDGKDVLHKIMRAIEGPDDFTLTTHNTRIFYSVFVRRVYADKHTTFLKGIACGLAFAVLIGLFWR